MVGKEEEDVVKVARHKPAHTRRQEYAWRHQLPHLVTFRQNHRKNRLNFPTYKLFHFLKIFCDMIWIKYLPGRPIGKRDNLTTACNM
eukprot:g11930.t1